MVSIKKKNNNLITFETLRNIRNFLLRILDIIGINNFFRLFNRRKLIILMFHGVSARSFSHNIRKYLPKTTFLKIIEYLKKKNYIFITLTDWLKIVKNDKKLKQRYVILTFDDGYKNVVEQAYPIMKKHGAKGCFYVVSEVIESQKLNWIDYIEMLVRTHTSDSFDFYYYNNLIKYPINSELNIKHTFSDIKNKLRILTNKDRFKHLNQFKLKNVTKNFPKIPRDYLIANSEDLKLLDKNILEIGCHSKTHPLLEYLDDEEYYDELFESKKDLEKIDGNSIDHFSYPVGSYNEKVVQLTKKYGYSTAVTVEYGFNTLKTDLFKLKRINVQNDFILFKYKISGLHNFLEKRFNIDLS